MLWSSASYNAPRVPMDTNTALWPRGMPELRNELSSGGTGRAALAKTGPTIYTPHQHLSCRPGPGRRDSCQGTRATYLSAAYPVYNATRGGCSSEAGRSICSSPPWPNVGHIYPQSVLVASRMQGCWYADIAEPAFPALSECPGQASLFYSLHASAGMRRSSLSLKCLSSSDKKLQDCLADMQALESEALLELC